MKSFKTFLNEGFTHFPKSESDIDNLKFVPDDKKENLKKLFAELSMNKSGIKDPIALDATKPNIIKLMRVLSFDYNLKSLSKKYGFSITAGNGSRGGQGSASKGFSFEKNIVKDVERYIEAGLDADFIYPDMMKTMHNAFLKDAKKISVVLDGAANTKRPIFLTDVSMLIGGRDLQVGPKVTDVTVTADGKPYYISAKYGGTVTFFNSGVRKIFPPSDFKKGHFSNKEANILLNAFGIDEQKFIEIFSSYDTSKSSVAKKVRVDTTGKANKRLLQQLLLSGVGYGYWMAHLRGKHIEFYEMTRRKMIDSAKISKVTVLYPQPGSAKRIDIEVLTNRYDFKINIRNKQGGLYPTHIMADYKYR